MARTTDEGRRRQGEALRRIRLALALSQADVAQAVGRSQQMIARFEAGSDGIA